MWCDRALLLQSQGRHQEASSSYLQSIHYRPNLAGKSIVRLFSFHPFSPSISPLYYTSVPFSFFNLSILDYIWCTDNRICLIQQRGLRHYISTRVNAHHLKMGNYIIDLSPTGRCRKHSLQWAFSAILHVYYQLATSFVRRLRAPGGDGCGCADGHDLLPT